MLNNSFLLYEQPSCKKTRTAFLEDITKSILKFESNKSQKDNKTHVPMFDSKKRRCFICYKNGIRSETKYKCTTCKKHVHPGECWKEHLKEKNDEVDL